MMSEHHKIVFAEQMKGRTKALALRVIRLFQNLPKSEEAKILGRQLLRSATSVAANYRAVCRARSDAEYYAKLCIVVEEIDETLFWLELLIESNIMPSERLTELISEVSEMLAIFAKSKRTTKLKLISRIIYQ